MRTVTISHHLPRSATEAVTTIQRNYLRCHALRLKQSDQHPVYLFSLTAEQLEGIADVARMSRTANGALDGYQRSIAEDHVGNIAAYLNSEDPLFPNGLILTFHSSVKFEKRRGPGNDDGSAIAGNVLIPVPGPGEPKPGWIVDGQQRWIALSRAKNREFAVPISAFIADEIGIQRDQFIRINSVKPLDKALVTELLPEVALAISPRLTARKIPSTLVEHLNSNEESPFVGLIRRPSMTAPDRKRAVVQDTSLVNALEESLTTANGSLFPHRNLATGEVDFDAIWWILITYWKAVRLVFPDAWGKPATQSRLMHGVGIRAMGRLMDKMMSSVVPFDDRAPDQIQQALESIAPHCHWTSGAWVGLNDLPWNDLENTSRHIRTLSNLLIRLHLSTRSDAS
jgi:DGQHR domain-containing protein